jgi:tRNA(adenine34) deaminase
MRSVAVCTGYLTAIVTISASIDDNAARSGPWSGHLGHHAPHAGPSMVAMSGDRERTFVAQWTAWHPAGRRSLELAFESLLGGGLAVGSVLTDEVGTIVAGGRNRAYDPPGGTDALQGTPLAHAEMNVLATVRTERDLAGCTLWSTQQPCAMCLAAASFTGVGTIRYIAPDPWAIASGVSGSAGPDEGGMPRMIGPAEDPWLVAANLLFMLGGGLRHGAQHPTIARNRELEPETALLVIELLERPETSARLATRPTLVAFLGETWHELVTAADARSRRRARL